MNEALPPPPSESENFAVAEVLRAERRKVLDLAGNFHKQAIRNNAVAAGVAEEMYVITDDHDIPLLSEKMRIVPFNTRIASISEAYLYIPIDLDFRNETQQKMVPNIIFMRMQQGVRTVRQVIVSEETVWVFKPNETMQFDLDSLTERGHELDIPAIFPDGENLDFEEEQKLLQEMQGMLSDRNRFRLGSQHSDD